MKSLRLSTPIFFLICLALTATFVFSVQKIFDFDALYHFRHAFLYRAEGVFTSGFPYTSASLLSVLPGDLWYGFHLLLIPFTFIDSLTGVRLATAVLSAAAISSFYWLLRRLSIRYPLFWTVILVFSSGDFFFRLFMARPHVLSLFLSFLFLGLSTSKRFWPLFIISALIAWLHLSLAWVPILISLTLSAVVLLSERRLLWLPSSAAVSGIIFGWLLRPHPLAAAKLAYVQIVDLFLIKRQGIPLKFGRELNTLLPSDATIQYLPLAVLIAALVITTVYLLWRGRLLYLSPLPLREITLTSTLLTVLFTLLAIFAARRSADFVSGFAVLAAASLLTLLLSNPIYRLRIGAPLLPVIGGVFLLLLFILSIWVVPIFIKNSRSPDYLRSAALWLKDNTPPGTVVFNPYWDDFPNLFFWNPNNYYIGGMDPIFTYMFSPERYWQMHFIAYTGAPLTCASIRCRKEEAEPVTLVLARDFNARYLFVNVLRNAVLARNLDADLVPGLTEVYHAPDARIYRVDSSAD